MGTVLAVYFTVQLLNGNVFRAMSDVMQKFKEENK